MSEVFGIPLNVLLCKRKAAKRLWTLLKARSLRQLMCHWSPANRCRSRRQLAVDLVNGADPVARQRSLSKRAQ